jgi:hypothetical protein
MYLRSYLISLALNAVSIFASFSTPPETGFWSRAQIGLSLAHNDVFLGEGTNSTAEQLCTPNGLAKNPQSPDLSAPCNVMAIYYANCTYGASPFWLSNNLGGASEEPEKVQQICFCIGAYWEYASGCNTCLKQHGAAEGARGWIPATYLSQQSMGYCATSAFDLKFGSFLASFTPSTMVTDASATASSNFLGTNTAATAYFTATTIPSIPVLPGPTHYNDIGTYVPPGASSATEAATGLASNLQPTSALWMMVAALFLV